MDGDSDQALLQKVVTQIGDKASNFYEIPPAARKGVYDILAKYKYKDIVEEFPALWKAKLSQLRQKKKYRYKRAKKQYVLAQKAAKIAVARTRFRRRRFSRPYRRRFRRYK